jgi:hypothetical protein
VTYTSRSLFLAASSEMVSALINRPALGNFPSSDWAHVLKTGVLLVGSLVGIGASHGRENLVQTLRGSTENASLENMNGIRPD